MRGVNCGFQKGNGESQGSAGVPFPVGGRGGVGHFVLEICNWDPKFG